MSGCCHLNRRQLLRWGALVAASPLLSGLADPERAYAAAGGAPPVPMNLELVTLTETSLVITWYTGALGSSDEFGRLAPAPADGEVWLGTSPTALRQVYTGAAPTPYHYAEITGLEPGQTYYYVAKSGGIPAAPAAFSLGNPAGTSTGGNAFGGPYRLTTPRPPKGEFLFSVVLCNDLHLGETVAGLATTQAGQQIPPGFSQRPGEPPYSEVMANALVADARSRHASYLVAAGDISSEAVPKDLSMARRILDGFGTYERDYVVARGNHDRSHAGSPYSACRADPRGPGLHDCFHDAFFPGNEPTWFARDVHGLRVLGLDTYDKVGNGGDNGSLSAEQFAFVTRELAAAPDQPTLVFGHHPVSLEASLTTTEPLIFDLDPQQALRLEALYAKSPGVFLHHQGHTHRNKRTASPNTPGVVYQEVCATKEYPGGFHLLRVHTGGYALNFYKTRSDLAREWSERTRQESFGGYPYYTFGNVNDRNYVADHDFSGLRRPASGSGGGAGSSGGQGAGGSGQGAGKSGQGAGGSGQGAGGSGRGAGGGGGQSSSGVAGRPGSSGAPTAPGSGLAATGGLPEALPAAGMVAGAAALYARSRRVASDEPPPEPEVPRQG